jgi:hypothetical protein
MNMCHHLMGHPTPNHDVGRVMVSCALRMHLKGCFSINLVVLVVILLLHCENFLIHEEDVFVPILGVPQQMLCSCSLDFLQSRGKEVSLSAKVRCHM